MVNFKYADDTKKSFIYGTEIPVEYPQYDDVEDSGKNWGRNFGSKPDPDPHPLEVSPIRRLVMVLRTTADNVKMIER